MHESLPSAAARGGAWWQPSALISSRSLQSSCPRYSDLHRGLSPRLSIYPIHPAIQPSIHPPVQSIDQSASLSLTHSIHPSIHPSARSIHPCSPNQSSSLSLTHSFHPSIHYCLRRVTHVVSSRRLAAINESINQLSNFAKYFRKFPLLRAHFAKHFL